LTLVEVLRDENRKRAVIADGVRLVESEVRARSGLSGMAVRTGYKALTAVRPGVVEAALTALLPEFAPVLDPFYAAGRAAGSVRDYFGSHAEPIADALLAVTDRRAATASHQGVKRAYQGLRGLARREVAQSVPGLARLIEKHVG
jgi:hypothetical protein